MSLEIVILLHCLDGFHTESFLKTNEKQSIGSKIYTAIAYYMFGLVINMFSMGVVISFSVSFYCFGKGREFFSVFS